MARIEGVSDAEAGLVTRGVFQGAKRMAGAGARSAADHGAQQARDVGGRGLFELALGARALGAGAPEEPRVDQGGRARRLRVLNRHRLCRRQGERRDGGADPGPRALPRERRVQRAREGGARLRGGAVADARRTRATRSSRACARTSPISSSSSSPRRSRGRTSARASTAASTWPRRDSPRARCVRSRSDPSPRR